MDLRAEIREFLSTRRARITPEQAGLPAYGGNRRVKGLRREEVAMLAGVSVDYYVRMERGSLGGASESVLDALANALHLEDAERDHLFALARASGETGVTPPPRSAAQRAPGRPAGPRRHHRRPRLGPQRPARHPRHEPAGPRALPARARGPASPGQHHPLRLPASRRGARALRRLRPGRPGRRRDAPPRGRPQPARQGPHRAGRRALHPERALPEALGLPGRALPPQRPQAAPPPGRRAARPRLRGPRAALRTRPPRSTSTPPPTGTPTSDALKLLASWAASQEQLATEQTPTTRSSGSR